MGRFDEVCADFGRNSSKTWTSCVSLVIRISFGDYYGNCIGDYYVYRLYLGIYLGIYIAVYLGEFSIRFRLDQNVALPFSQYHLAATPTTPNVTAVPAVMPVPLSDRGSGLSLRD